MPKSATQFVCQSCENVQVKWSGRCPECGAWNSLVEASVAPKSSRGSNVAAKPVKLHSLKSGSSPRLGTGLADFDQILGGGVVPASVTLLSGDPGIGKSTLALQIAAHLAAVGNVLYVSGEETAEQIKLRADRLVQSPGELDLLTETDAENVADLIAAGGYSVAVIDSIQTLTAEGATGQAGAVSQITACANLIRQAAKSSGTAILIIGHVTKEGSIAGPKLLEHLVDVVLYFEGERFGGFKVLRCIKNRFGSTNEVALVEMTSTGLIGVPNPSAALLAERQAEPGSVVLATREGSRAFLVEVQALVAASSFGYPKRTAVGIDLNRLNLLIAVLGRLSGYQLNTQDVYVNIVGGLKISEPAADLAIIMAIASALKQRAVAKDMVIFGEVGLNGEIRSVGHIEKRLSEAKKMGFKRALSPSYKSQVGLIGVTTVAQAIKAALDQK